MNGMPRVCSVSISISNGIEVRLLWDCHGAVVGLLGNDVGFLRDVARISCGIAGDCCDIALA